MGVIGSLCVASPATAAWGPPQPLAPDSFPRAAVETSAGGLVLLGGGARAASRFTWAPGAAQPGRVALPAFKDGGDDRWAVNRGGDAVLVSAGGRHVRAIAVDADGVETSMFETLDRDRNVTDVVADVGGDGTAAVAWTQWRSQTET